MKWWKPSPEEREYIELIMSMSADCLQDNGVVVTRRTFTTNLRMIADQMDRLKDDQEAAINERKIQ